MRIPADSVLIPPGPAALWLERLLRPGLQGCRREGVALPDDVVRLVVELQHLADRSRNPSGDGTPVVPTLRLVRQRDLDEDTVPAAEAARRLGVSGRRVRQLLAAGTLRGSKSGQVWQVSEVSVVERQQQRQED